MEAIDKFAREPGLEPTYERPHFTKTLDNIELIAEGQTAHLEALYLPKGDPSLSVEWLRNGHPMPQGSFLHSNDFAQQMRAFLNRQNVKTSAATRYKLLNDFGVAVLDVCDLIPEDSGVYTCKIKNRHGDATSSCTVKVQGELLEMKQEQCLNDAWK